MLSEYLCEPPRSGSLEAISERKAETETTQRSESEARRDNESGGNRARPAPAIVAVTEKGKETSEILSDVEKQ